MELILKGDKVKHTSNPAHTQRADEVCDCFVSPFRDALPLCSTDRLSESMSESDMSERHC
jgi:hypothetical protein